MQAFAKIGLILCVFAMLLSPASAGTIVESVTTTESMDPAHVGPMAAKYTCSSSSSLFIRKTCNIGPYYVVDDQLAVSFVVPFLGSGNSNVNLQEQTPIAGDYITFYDRTCGALLVTSNNGASCFGGLMRSWHYNNYHKFRGSLDWDCYSALHCSASVSVRYY